MSSRVEAVFAQWKNSEASLTEVCKEADFACTIQTTGHGSDGDSRRYKIVTFVVPTEDTSLPDADLLAYPSVEESVTAWNDGFDEARAMAISLGINSKENRGNVPKEFWEKPWIGEIDDAAEMRNEEMKN